MGASGVNTRLAELAGRQYGVVSRAQMSEIGLGRNAIAARIRAGRLLRVQRGVYAVGHMALTREGRWLAAVLACGDGALLSHRSAGALWELARYDGARIDVTVPPANRNRSKSAIVVHRADREPATHHGIPTTTPMQTLTDLSYVLPERAVERALEQAEKLQLLDAAQAGPRLRSIIEAHDFAPTRSELEVAFRALCRRHRLPQPQVNARVHGYEVDFSWPEHRLIVETDGHHDHGTRAAFERDRARDAELIALGWRVVRFTYRQVMRRPREVAGVLRRCLATPAGSAPALR
jgi:very-short-patch-repair endonuclease